MKEKAFHKILDIITKVIFFIALFSLTGLFGYGLCGSHIGYTMGITSVGFGAFKIYIEDVLYNKLAFLYLIFCCIYCVFYIIRLALHKGIKMGINKNSILKSILLFSVIPYFIFLGAGVYSYEFGINQRSALGFSGYNIYGKDAFDRCIDRLFYEYKILFFICLAYQIFYLTRYLIKKHKSKNVVLDNNSELQDKN